MQRYHSEVTLKLHLETGQLFILVLTDCIQFRNCIYSIQVNCEDWCLLDGMYTTDLGISLRSLLFVLASPLDPLFLLLVSPIHS